MFCLICHAETRFQEKTCRGCRKLVQCCEACENCQLCAAQQPLPTAAPTSASSKSAEPQAAMLSADGDRLRQLALDNEEAYINSGQSATQSDDAGANASSSSKASTAAAVSCPRERWAAEEHKKQFRLYMTCLLEAYPPDQYHYIGIGASCDLVLAALRILTKSPDINAIPISSINKVSAPVTKPQSKILRKYIRAFVPNLFGSSQKKILLMDVTSSGASLGQVKEAVLQIRKKKKSEVDVECLSLNNAYHHDRSFFAHDPAQELKFNKLGAVKKKRLLSRPPNDVEKANHKITPNTVFTRWTENEYYSQDWGSLVLEHRSCIASNLEDEEYKSIGRIFRKVRFQAILDGKLTPQDLEPHPANQEKIEIMVGSWLKSDAEAGACASSADGAGDSVRPAAHNGT